MKIVLIGDSIRIGYQELVRQKIGNRAEVVWPEANCGHSLMHRENLNQWYLEPQADVIHFNCGIWDLWPDAGTHARTFTISTYVRNLKLIVRSVKARTKARLIWATTTPLLTAPYAAAPKEKCTVAPVVERYNAAARRVMADYGVGINDLYGAVMEAGVYECLSDDLCHMTPVGSDVLAEAVVRAVMG